ncbi:helix-turn-helix domain-containing protein [Streptomyces mirabilis]
MTLSARAGLTAEQRKRREEVRIRALDLFEEGMKVPCIARELRVSDKSVYQWRRAWKAGGRQALRSKGPPGASVRCVQLPAGARTAWARSESCPRESVVIHAAAEPQGAPSARTRQVGSHSPAR